MSDLSRQLAGAETSAVQPAWLSALRHNAAEQFRRSGLPTRKDEAWKYTGLGALGRGDIRLEVGHQATGAAAPMRTALTNADLQVNMLDGRRLDVVGEMPAALSVMTLGEALATENPGLRALLESLPAEGSSQAFSALNTATLERGLVIHVTGNSDAGRLLLNYSSVAGRQPRLINSRICVLLDAGASLELVEQFESKEHGNNAANVVLQAELEQGACLAHLRLQQEPDSATLITRTETSLRANSKYTYYGFDLGGGLVRHDLHATLNGEGAQARLNGAYLVGGKRHVDNHARVDHVAPGGVSEQYFRGVAGGSGKAVFNTAVYVHPGADGTEALQSNANILLSPRAEIDTKPELEIYADEVMASHGATVGQLDEKAIFYLRSRGLKEDQARQLMITAFCRSVSDRLADRELAEVISARLLEALPEE